ncbi:HAD-IC family P-type ATPase, partial [Candidatus Bathyarchaeota archaeon]|nr:HAD-IC family P-type ATPase [Candidatus Bathyarchaeota archaeon]
METPPSKKKLQTVHAEEALRLLGTGFDGLTEEEARSRLQQYGLNKLKEEKKKSVITLFLEQFKSILVIILIIAAIISGYLAIIEGEPLTDSYVILSVLILNAILGFIQEYRAEKAVEALKKLINPRSTVIRGGEERIIDSSELVPGDIVKLEAGDRVPADLRVVESFNLDVDEAILTGESLPVSKSCYPVPEFSDDQTCFIYMGTVLTSGRALTVVVYTGMSTVFGGIAGLVQSTSAEEPPINRKVETLGKQLGAISILLSLWIFITGSYIFMHPIEETLLTAISLAVSAIPEGLPAVLTITMALGVAAMAREKAIIKKLASVETLGSTTVICSDKTGTITKNEMTVRKIVLPYHLVDVTGSGYDPDGEFFHGDNVIEASNDESLNMSLRIGVQCNNASLIKEQNKWVISGDPTEGALVVAAVKAGLKKINNEEEKLLVEYSFDSNRKRMSVIYHNSSGLTSYIKGAPEELLKDSIYIKEGKNIREISKKD